MRQFEYVMVLLSIVLGLGITHLLLGVGNLISRISGHGPSVRIDWIHLLWVFFIFWWLIGFWWWEFSWSAIENWGLALYLFLVLYTICLFLLCVVLFPPRTDDVADFGAYFMRVRPWFFSLLVLLTAVDISEAFLKGSEYMSRLGAMYWGLSVAQVLIGVIGIATTNRRVHGVLAAFAVTYAVVQLLTTYPLLS
jgi:hypothetical protein